MYSLRPEYKGFKFILSQTSFRLIKFTENSINIYYMKEVYILYKYAPEFIQLS